MRNQVNARRTAFREHERSNGARIQLPDSLHLEMDEEDLPYLEALTMTARKHPYWSLAAIVALVGSVLSAIVAACVILFTSFFTMYGTMREMNTEIRQLRQENAIIASEIKVLRTYEASVLSRQNFIAGLMSPDDQKRLNEYDRSNPINPAPMRPRPNPDQ